MPTIRSHSNFTMFAKTDSYNVGHIAVNFLKTFVISMITHNSVHMVEEVFVGCDIVGVVGADHVLNHIRDKSNLFVMFVMEIIKIWGFGDYKNCWCSRC